MDYKKEYERLKTLVEDNLGKYLLREECLYTKSLTDSMKYSVFAGGKRLRPVLLLAGCALAGGDEKKALPFACAIEYIHTYSLIHDDLPAMDDDDLRRGKPTNHKVFGEACAILAGDALLNRAYEVMFEACQDSDGGGIRAGSLIGAAAGHGGMVGGQIADVEGEDPSKHCLDRLEFIHLNKTGALIKAAVLAGAAIGGADEAAMKALEEFALNLGLAFQICDDILDIVGNEAELGKPVGSDDKNGKLTYPSLVGLEESQKIYAEIHSRALEALKPFGEKGAFLRAAAEDLYSRVK